MNPGILIPRGAMMRELETRLTQKGQVTIPAEVRSRLGLKPRDRVVFELEDDAVKIKPAASKVLAGYGAVRPRQRPEDWKQVEAEIEQAIAEEAVGED
ncbi:MAG: AbrB/MazE/SpoVT family DNA-binding domain-containing protein [Candidatus Levybacteria bacterium]|nr:AbrB/MazE/SpoVT family DNA-binding domain-containing protein [Candidatus Levybacteria bacterium]